MTIPNKQFVTGAHDYQVEVLSAFDNRLARFFMLEWGRRHRKTTLAINLLIRECAKHPDTKYVYVAPTQVWARNIVWDDPNMIWKALPDKNELGWKKDEAKMLITFANGSMLKIGGSDKPDTLRGIDAIGAVFDEWALCKENLWTEIFRPIIAGSTPPHLPKEVFRWAMFLYTPKGINHATMMFDKACCLSEGGTLPDAGQAEMMRPGWFASRLIGEKAGLMTDKELELAKEDMPKVMYDQEINCARVTEEARTLITSAMLNRLNGVNWKVTRTTIPQIRKIVAIDPAFTGDMCVLKAFENTRVMETKKFHPLMTNEIILEAKMMAQRLGTKNFIIDTVGIGKPIADTLACDEADYNVQYFNSSENSSDLKMYANMKAEAWYYTSEQIRKMKTEAIEDKELLRQLPIAAMYTAKRQGGAMIMQLKDVVKKLLGCSPDDSDCYNYGIWGLQFVEPDGDGSGGGDDDVDMDMVAA